MKICITAILLFFIVLVLTSCTINGTQVLAKQLQPNELIKIHNTMTPNLAERSKCSSPPSVLIVNTETSDQDYTIYIWWPTEVYITPKTLMDDVVIYMSDAFNRTGIKTDQTSTKVIQVSMEKIGNSYSFLNYSAEAQLKIILPEKKYTMVYGHSDTTPKGLPIATAYTIHAITWKVINDPFVQDYILCR